MIRPRPHRSCHCPLGRRIPRRADSTQTTSAHSPAGKAHSNEHKAERGRRYLCASLAVLVVPCLCSLLWLLRQPRRQTDRQTERERGGHSCTCGVQSQGEGHGNHARRDDTTAQDRLRPPLLLPQRATALTARLPCPICTATQSRAKGHRLGRRSFERSNGPENMFAACLTACARQI
jgi:hypothetical protein